MEARSLLPFSPGITRFFSLFNDTQLDVRFSRASISRVRASSSRCVRRGGKHGREEKEEEAKDASSRGDRSSIKKKIFSRSICMCVGDLLDEARFYFSTPDLQLSHLVYHYLKS